MKRIISLIMSVLMIATMFCGFAVTSNAAEEGIAHLTVVASEVAEDGTFTVEYWVKDNSDYGWHSLGFELTYDSSKVAPVTSRTLPDALMGDVDVAYDITNVMYWIDEVTAAKIRRNTKSIPGIASQTTIDDDMYELFITPTGKTPAIGVGSSASDATNCYAVQFNIDYFDEYNIDYEAFTYDETKGMLWASATYEVLDGASGTTEIGATCYSALTTDAFGSTKTVYANEQITIASATVDLGSDEPEVPTLPAGITMEVSTEASMRLDPETTGIRFSSKVTVDGYDWANISEMGTAIVVAGTTPGSDKTLKVPARVDLDGAYLQSYTTDESGKKTFSEGIVSADNVAEYTGVISNIQDSTMEFEAYAYVVIDGVTFYSAANSTAKSLDAIEASAEADSNYEGNL